MQLSAYYPKCAVKEMAALGVEDPAVCVEAQRDKPYGQARYGGGPNIGTVF